jgi:hypothetical protein
VLASARPVDGADYEILARLATLTGRCKQSAQFLRLATQPVVRPIAVPPGLVTGVQGQLPRIALGCDAARRLIRVSDEPAIAGASERDRLAVEYNLVGPLIAIGYPDNAEMIRRQARATSDFVLVAMDSLLLRQPDAARRILRSAMEKRASRRTDFTPDAALAEATGWLALADTANALSIADQAINGIPLGDPLSAENATRNTLRIASLGRLLVLRADIARARGERADRWARLIVALWSDADPELQGTVRRMRTMIDK